MPDVEYNLNDPDFLNAIDDVPFWSAPFGIQLLDAVIPKTGMTVLDIGSGLGFPAIELAARMGGRGTVYALDPWTAAQNRARQKAAALKLQNVTFLEASAEHIPLPDSSVDVIISNNGINNVQDLNQTLRECARVIRQGGQFVATVNLPDTMIEFYRLFEQVLNDEGLGHLVAELLRHIRQKRLPLEELKQLMKLNGFTVSQTSIHHFRYRFADGTAMLNYPFIRYAFLPSWQDVVPRCHRDRVFAEIESRMNTAAGVQGEWILTVPFVVIDSRGTV